MDISLKHLRSVKKESAPSPGHSYSSGLSLSLSPWLKKSQAQCWLCTDAITIPPLLFSVSPSELLLSLPDRILFALLDSVVKATVFPHSSALATKIEDFRDIKRHRFSPQKQHNPLCSGHQLVSLNPAQS